MRQDNTRFRSHERGRGFVGFLIALVVVVLVGKSLRAWYVVKHRADVIDQFTYETIEKADLSKMSVDDVRAKIFEKTRELGLDILKADQIDVVNENQGWRVHFDFRDTIYLPGYSVPTHTRVDKSWTRF